MYIYMYLVYIYVAGYTCVPDLNICRYVYMYVVSTHMYLVYIYVSGIYI